MSKDLHISVLLDFYGSMLTDKQRDVIELYYNEDLSLAEIAEHEKITRQGVRDSIKRGEVVLIEMEQRLGLVAKFKQLSETLADISRLADSIHRECEMYKYSREISEKSTEIMKAANEGSKNIF